LENNAEAVEAKKYSSKMTFCGALTNLSFSVLVTIRTIQPARTIKPTNLTPVNRKDSVDRGELRTNPKRKSVAMKPNSPIFGRMKKTTMSGISIAPPAIVTKP